MCNTSNGHLVDGENLHLSLWLQEDAALTNSTSNEDKPPADADGAREVAIAKNIVSTRSPSQQKRVPIHEHRIYTCLPSWELHFPPSFYLFLIYLGTLFPLYAHTQNYVVSKRTDIIRVCVDVSYTSKQLDMPILSVR